MSPSSARTNNGRVGRHARPAGRRPKDIQYFTYRTLAHTLQRTSHLGAGLLSAFAHTYSSWRASLDFSLRRRSRCNKMWYVHVRTLNKQEGECGSHYLHGCKCMTSVCCSSTCSCRSRLRVARVAECDSPQQSACSSSRRVATYKKGGS